MKILHVLYSNKYSGAENVACQIIEMFNNDNGVEMAYCSRDGQIRTVLQEKDIRFYPVKNLSKKELKKVISDFNPDIIHAHDFRASIACSKFAKKIAVISHLHNNSPWLKKFGLKSIIYGWSCRKYEKILTVSNSVFDEFVFGKCFKSKLICIGNPINVEVIRKKADEFVYDKHYDICVCGRLTQPKNPFGTLKILSKLSVDFSTVFIGDGELKEEVVDKIKELKLTDKVDLVGFQENPYPIMKNCKLLLMPSLWEGFGLVAVEALSLGLPVVCSNVGGLPTIVDDKCGKICNTENDYIDELEKLLQKENYYNDKKAKAICRAKELNNYKRYNNLLNSIYKLDFEAAVNETSCTNR